VLDVDQADNRGNPPLHGGHPQPMNPYSADPGSARAEPGLVCVRPLEPVRAPAGLLLVRNKSEAREELVPVDAWASISGPSMQACLRMS